MRTNKTAFQDQVAIGLECKTPNRPAGSAASRYLGISSEGSDQKLSSGGAVNCRGLDATVEGRLARAVGEPGSRKYRFGGSPRRYKLYKVSARKNYAFRIVRKLLKLSRSLTVNFEAKTSGRLNDRRCSQLFSPGKGPEHKRLSSCRKALRELS